MAYSLIQTEKILDTYSFDEILEMNDLTYADILEYLINQEFVDLPEIRPVDLDEN